MPNPFEILGVTRQSSEAEIKSAFRQKAKDCHPDTHPDDPEATTKFAAISAAYDELKDGKAATYQDPQVQNPFGGARGPFHGFQDIHDIFRNFEESHRRARGKNDDIGLIHAMSLEEAYTGKTLKVPLNLRRGHVVMEVTVPPGVDTGVRLTVKGGGQDTDANLPNGDLFVTINILPHATLHRSGIDLVCVKEIDMFTAILGGTIVVQTINGKTVEIAVPPGRESGSQLRIGGHGMPMTGVKDRFGDMFIALDVKMPKAKLRDDQIDFIKAARDVVVTGGQKYTDALNALRS